MISMREERKALDALKLTDPAGIWEREMDWLKRYRLAVVGERRTLSGAIVTQIDYVPR
jgi:hypothetical protein